MMNLKTKLLIWLLLLFISSAPCFSQSTTAKEIVVTFISAKCVDTTYTPSLHQTRVYPPRTTYVKDKLVYELDITLKLNGEGFIYSKPLAITCYMPDGNTETIIINEKLEELIPGNFYEYKMFIETKGTGWAKITVGEWDDNEQQTNESGDITFIHNSVYLE